MVHKKIKFNDFAHFYSGQENRDEQIKILKDALISIESNDEISHAELLELYDHEIDYKCSLDYDSGFYEIEINGIWWCDSIENPNL